MIVKVILPPICTLLCGFSGLTSTRDLECLHLRIHIYVCARDGYVADNGDLELVAPDPLGAPEFVFYVSRNRHEAQMGQTVQVDCRPWYYTNVTRVVA